MPRITPTLLLLVSLGTPSLAAAQDPTAHTRAAELNREAGEHAKRGEWSVAAALLMEAYRLNKDPALLVNLAATEFKANRAVDALHHLRAYLADPAADEKVKSAINAELLPRALAATGRIAIRFPAGASLALDGEALPSPTVSSSLTTDVMPGSHTIEIRSSTGTTKRTVEVAPGGSAEVQPDALTPPPEIAAPPSPPTPSPGPAPSADRGFWTPGHTVPLALLVAGVAAAGIGVGFSLGASSAANQAGTCGTNCPYSSLRDTYNRDSVLAVSLYAGAGVLGAASLVTWLVWPHETVEARVGDVKLRPYVAATQAGIVGNF